MMQSKEIELDRLLRAGLDQLDLTTSPDFTLKSMEYISLLSRWNKVYNLTSVRDLRQMVITHLLDCCAIVPFLSGTRILDIGSGAGLPGLVLAMLKPDWEFTLVDANQKKTRFLTQAVIALNLDNVTIRYGRVEQHTHSTAIDWITSRAFSSLDQSIAVSRHNAGPQTRWLAMKGQYPKQELSNLPADVNIEHIAALHVPGLAAQRHIVILSAANDQSQPLIKTVQ